MAAAHGCTFSWLLSLLHLLPACFLCVLCGVSALHAVVQWCRPYRALGGFAGVDNVVLLIGGIAAGSACVL